MKIFNVLFLLLIGCALFAQEDGDGPCGVYGPGTNGQVVQDCTNGPETYTSSCCKGNPAWFWTIDGNIDIFASTSLPLTFSGGTVVAATSGSITINWDCPDVCPPEGYVIWELTACGSEWFNPTVRIGCDICEPSAEQCFLLDCGACIGIYVNNSPVILSHNSVKPELFCFPLGSVGCEIFDCDENDDPVDGSSSLNINEPIAFIPEIQVVDVSELEDLVLSSNLAARTSQIKITIPDSNSETKLRVTDLNGNIIVAKSIHGNENLIPVENMKDGAYIVTIQNADYTFTKKVIIQN